MKRFGVMLDMSRNAVMKVSEVKNYIKIMKDFGYNMVMLYTEDTYEVENEPYFGYLRGRYSIDELKDIVAYCDELEIEIIPCIQTLAHIGTIFKWKAYKEIHDTDDIMLVGEERTYQLIENIFKTLRKIFKTEYIHIGMDEAHMLGLGKYLDKNGVHNRFDILYSHLKKILEIANNYSFKPIMWSDMFFRLANQGEYYAKPEMVTAEVVNACPDGIELVYWDYYHNTVEHYRDMMSSHKKFKGDTWFAGGAWCWKGFAPNNKWSIESMTPAMQVCAEQNVENIFITLWGDNGRECSPYAVLPSIYAIRRIYDGVTDMEQIKSEFKAKAGEDFDAMCYLDEPDFVGYNGDFAYNPSKHMLYSDPFLGNLDTTAKAGGNEEFAAIAKKFHAFAIESNCFGYLFESMAALCDVLSIKYELGVKSRAIYKSGDKERLSSLLSDFRELVCHIDVFYKTFRILWYKENKEYGFDVQDQRIGGLRQRILSCADRIEDYLNGVTENIPELEEELLDYLDGGEKFYLNDWKSNITVNNI